MYYIHQHLPHGHPSRPCCLYFRVFQKRRMTSALRSWNLPFHSFHPYCPIHPVRPKTLFVLEITMLTTTTVLPAAVSRDPTICPRRICRHNIPRYHVTCFWRSRRDGHPLRLSPRWGPPTRRKFPVSPCCHENSWNGIWSRLFQDESS
jgi:hypothetical protein